MRQHRHRPDDAEQASHRAGRLKGGRTRSVFDVAFSLRGREIAMLELRPVLAVRPAIANRRRWVTGVLRRFTSIRVFTCVPVTSP